MPLHLAITACLLSLCTAGATRPAPLDDGPTAEPQAWWGNWRGPLHTGVAPAGDPPVEWSEEKNVRWKVEIPGLGISSPIVWRDRIYLTTAVEVEGREEGMTEFVVLCLDRKDGRTLWSSVVEKLVPHERIHKTASQASNSPLTDGERIYAYFGSRGMHCLDMDGEILWSKDLGLMHTRREFGEGSSPALHGDTLVINWDHEADSFVIALDKNSGEELWSRERDEITSWATPLVVSVDGREQVIITGTGASRAYDLETGEVVWSCEGMTTNCIPSPVYADGVVYLMSGFRGAALQAVRLAGAKGEITGSDHVVWTHDRNTSYTPSALLYEGCYYFLRSNSGVLSCLDAATGEIHYEDVRLEDMRSIYASPVGAGGRVYITSREGVTKVIRHGPEFELLATSRLDDEIDASAAVVGDELYLRGRARLYCIAED
jgi:outer membrane protein assembly factor BamB